MLLCICKTNGPAFCMVLFIMAHNDMACAAARNSCSVVHIYIPLSGPASYFVPGCSHTHRPVRWMTGYPKSGTTRLHLSLVALLGTHEASSLAPSLFSYSPPPTMTTTKLSRQQPMLPTFCGSSYRRIRDMGQAEGGCKGAGTAVSSHGMHPGTSAV